MRHRILKTIAEWCIHHYRLILILNLICTGWAIYLITQLTFDTTFMRMLPENSPEVERFQEVTREFGSATDLYLLVEYKNFNQARKFVDQLKPKLEKLSEVKTVQGRLVDIAYFEEHGLLFLPLHQLAQGKQALERRMPTYRAIVNNPRFTTIFHRANEDLFSQITGAPGLTPGTTFSPPPEDLHFGLERINAFCRLFTKYAEQGEKLGPEPLREYMSQTITRTPNQFQGRGQIRDGYLLSEDGTHMLVAVRLAIDALSTELGMNIYGKILEETKQVQADFPGIQFGYTGHFAIGYEDQQNVLSRIQILSFVSLFLVLLLFVYIDRSLYGPLIVGIPLLIAVLWTFGFVKLTFGFVSITSAIFGILLFGLGIDFAIHLIVRYNEERSEGYSLEDAVVRALTLSGPAILTGGLTTVLSFFSLNISEFKAAQHLGTTSGWGILCCLIAMLVTLPALIVFTRKLAGKWGTIHNVVDIPLLDWWVKVVIRRPYLTLVIATLITTFLGFQLRNFELEYDLEKIMSRNMSSLKVKKEIENRFQISTDFVFLLANGQEEAKNLARKATKVKGADGLPIFSRVETITNYIPENQPEKIKLLDQMFQSLAKIPIPPTNAAKAPLVEKDLKDILVELNRFRKTVFFFGQLFPKDYGDLAKDILQNLEECEKILQKNGPQMVSGLSYFQSLIGTMFRHRLSQVKTQTHTDPITISNLPKYMKDQFIGKSSQQFAVYAYPRRSVLNRENIEEALEAARSLTKDSTGHMVMVYHFIYLGLRDFPKVLAVVITLVMILLLIDFQNPIYVFLSLVPLTFGAISAFGLIVMSSQLISILSLVSFPLIFGIGIDDGVHVIHRYRESSHHDIAKTISSTGKAILLTSVTTMASFGILLLTNHHGFIAMGLLILVGIGMCFVSSVTVLPALLVILEQWGVISRKVDGETKGSSFPTDDQSGEKG